MQFSALRWSSKTGLQSRRNNVEFTLERPTQSLSTKSITNIGLVVLLHLIVLYALASGLARDVVNTLTKPVEVRIIEDVKLPPPEPPKVRIEPPKFVKPPPAYVPPPEVRVTAPAENTIAAVTPVAPQQPVAPVLAEPVRPVVAKVGAACPDSTRIRQSLEYPPKALQDGISGNVVVQFVVAANGQTRDFDLIHGAHPLLNQAALAAVHRFNCVGQGRDVLVQVPFEFKVEG
jgi:protein TonB